jgi:hypothetical protein
MLEVAAVPGELYSDEMPLLKKPRNQIESVAAMRLLAEEKRVLSLECKLIEAELKVRRIDQLMSELTQQLAEDEKTAEHRRLLSLEIALTEAQIAKTKVEHTMKQTSANVRPERLESIVHQVYSKPPPTPTRSMTAAQGNTVTSNSLRSPSKPRKISGKLATILNRFEQAISSNHERINTAAFDNNLERKYSQKQAPMLSSLPIMRPWHSTTKNPAVHHIVPANQNQNIIKRPLNKVPVSQINDSSRTTSDRKPSPYDNVKLRKTKSVEATPSIGRGTASIAEELKTQPSAVFDESMILDLREKTEITNKEKPGRQSQNDAQPVTACPLSECQDLTQKSNPIITTPSLHHQSQSEISKALNTPSKAISVNLEIKSQSENQRTIPHSKSNVRTKGKSLDTKMGYMEVPLLISAGPTGYIEVPMLLSVPADQVGILAVPAEWDTSATAKSPVEETLPNHPATQVLDVYSTAEDGTIYDEETVLSYTYSVVNRTRSGHLDDDIESLKSELNSLKGELTALRRHDMNEYPKGDDGSKKYCQYPNWNESAVLQSSYSTINSDMEMIFEEVLESDVDDDDDRRFLHQLLTNSKQKINRPDAYEGEIYENSDSHDSGVGGKYSSDCNSDDTSFSLTIHGEMDPSSVGSVDPYEFMETLEEQSVSTEPLRRVPDRMLSMINTAKLRNCLVMDDDVVGERESDMEEETVQSEQEEIEYVEEYEYEEEISEHSLGPDERDPLCSILDDSDDNGSPPVFGDSNHEESIHFDENNESYIDYGYEDHAPTSASPQEDNHPIYRSMKQNEGYNDDDEEEDVLAMLIRKGRITSSGEPKIDKEESSDSSATEKGQDEFWGSREFVNLDPTQLMADSPKDHENDLPRSTEFSKSLPKRDKRSNFSNNSRRGGRRYNRDNHCRSSIDDLDAELQLHHLESPRNLQSKNIGLRRNLQRSNSCENMASRSSLDFDPYEESDDDAEAEQSRQEIFRLAHKRKGYTDIVQEAASLGRLTRLPENVIEANGTKVLKAPQSARRASVVATNLLDIQWNTTHHNSVCSELVEMGTLFRGKEVITESYHPSRTFTDFDSGWDNRTQSDSDDYDEFGGETDDEEDLPQNMIDTIVQRTKQEDRESNRRVLQHLQNQSRDEFELPCTELPSIHTKLRREHGNPKALRRGSIGTVTRTLGQEVIQRHSERQARIDSGHMHMQGRCNCPYCVSASPFQTYAYKKELERREGALPPGTWTRHNGQWSRVVTKHHVRDKISLYSKG